MAIQEQTQLDRPHQPVPANAEWTAQPLRPVASWVLVAEAAGAARLEMVWRVPDPRPADAAA